MNHSATPSKPQTARAQRRQITRPPRQDRSRKTFELLLDAAERLLRLRTWEEISIVDITREAGCSNGAVYGRFKNKDELLVALYDRHDAHLKERFAGQQKLRQQGDGSLETFIEREIDQLVRSMRQNRWLLRAMHLLARTRPEVVSRQRRRERKAMFDQIGAGFLRFQDQIDFPDKKRGVQLAIFMTATIVREMILYPGPHADTLRMTDRELRVTLKRMAMGFLGAGA